VDLNRYFKIKERNSNVKTEIIAGVTTFMTMAYILVVQPGSIVGYGPDPSLVDVAGVLVSKQAIMVMCALVSAGITALMAFYADMPFALSTGLGSNFMFGALIQSGHCSLGRAMAITLVSGLLFVTLSVFGIRDLIVRMIPKNIKVSIGTAIGFFIAYIGFKNTGIGSYANGIALGDFTQPAVILALFGLLLIGVLTAYKVPGAILVGIVIITVIGIPMGVTKVPSALLTVPSFGEVGNIVLNFDFTRFLTAETIALMFIVFVGDFFSTLGTVLGVAGKAKMLDENGDLPDIQKPFLVDAIGTCVGACCGCTTITTYVESSSGVEAGGRTGLTALTTALLFLSTVFAAPLFLMIPNAATGPALIFVGFLMASGITQVDFSDFTEAFGPFVMIMFTAFAGSIAGGIAAGILAYVFIKTATGRFKEVHPGMYLLSIPLYPVLHLRLNLTP
jgi:AGZA family xanthine/uracil permease-like MFS transporter